MPGQASGKDADTDDDFDLDLSLDFSEEETEAPASVEGRGAPKAAPSELEEVQEENGLSVVDPVAAPAPVDSFSVPTEVAPPSASPVPLELDAEVEKEAEDAFAIDLDESDESALEIVEVVKTAPSSEPTEDLSKEDLAAALEEVMGNKAKSATDPVDSEKPVDVMKKPASVMEDDGGEVKPLRSASGDASSVSTAEILASREISDGEAPLSGRKGKSPAFRGEGDALATQEEILKKDEQLLQGEIERLEKEFGPRFKKGTIYAFLGLVTAGIAGYAIFSFLGPPKDQVKKNASPPNGKITESGVGLKEETPAQPSGYKAALESASPPVTTVAEPEESAPSGDLMTASRLAVKQFFSSESVDDLLQVARDPARVKAFMRNYYETHAIFSREVRSVEMIDQTIIGKKVFWLMDVELDRFEQATVLVERIGDRFLVDWETSVHYNPVEWEVFVKKQPEGKFDMRVHATLQSEYRYPFSDDKKYLCVQLGDFKSDREIFGYAERNTPVAERIIQILKGEYTNESEYPLILTLEFPENTSLGEGLVHIRDFVTEHWIVVDSE